jgi:hypothetical protein
MYRLRPTEATEGGASHPVEHVIEELPRPVGKLRGDVEVRPLGKPERSPGPEESRVDRLDDGRDVLGVERLTRSLRVHPVRKVLDEDEVHRRTFSV